MERDEYNRAALEFVIGGACFGFAFGWAASATYRHDWPALALFGLVAAAYLVYRQYRINRSFDIGNRD
jgi:hypothetical protein